ncbi:MAG: N-acetylmuramoyl-L-alanine amidase CwlD [Bacillota bacterium]|nr:N-acetylmuramoyl-L-alanine amidase CwlD [Bacillota bacterium]
MRGFIFFKVAKLNHRLVLIVLLSLLLGGALYPYYVVHQERKAVRALSWSVASKVIVVDPGHGGVDPGAVGRTGILEKDINLAIAKRLAVLLSQAGAAVVLTREGDYDLSDPEHQSSLSVRKKDDLEARVELANKYRADLYLSIHVNSFPSPRWWGAQTFYYPPRPESKRLACLIQQEFLKTLGDSERWVKPEDFYIMRNVKMPAVIVEVGFISHPREEILMTEPVYQSRVAWCVYAGVVRYFAGEPAPPSPYQD